MITLITILGCGIIAAITYWATKRTLLKNAKEFDDCQKEPVAYNIQGKMYYTVEGARRRCEYLYKRHGINVPVKVITDFEDSVTVNSVDYFKLSR